VILKERFEQDLRLIASPQAWVLVVLLALALLAFGLFAPGWLLYGFMLFLVNSLVAVGLNILVGFTGQISLGHAGFFAIGAYTLGYLTQSGINWPFPLALLAAGVLSTIIGFVVGVPALRLTGVYLAIATLGFGEAVRQVVGQAKWLGGHDGLIVDRPNYLGNLNVFGIAFTGDRGYYPIVLSITVVLVLVAFNIARSHIGRALVAVRDAELAAQMSGINLSYYKTLAFAISAAYAGIGGALFAPLLGLIAPESFDLIGSITFLSMAIIGGLGTVAGGVLGAGATVILQQVLASAGSWNNVIYGGILIFTMMVEPQGLYGRWLKIKLYWKNWPF
jgi:branched-chain amino acid transport system permease protein